jgi:hypothetical protein
MDEITTNVMDLMNPDHDDEITSLEMEDFFTLITNSLKENTEQWKLYFQITMQKDVFEYLLKETNSEKMVKTQHLIYKYFAERFEKPNVEFMFFSALFKGFTMQYVFAPEMFSEEMIESFKLKLKELIIKEKIC